jgi:nitrogen-specific signal transduction histidine kinase/CheY-like chemotaxis protein
MDMINRILEKFDIFINPHTVNSKDQARIFRSRLSVILCIFSLIASIVLTLSEERTELRPFIIQLAIVSCIALYGLKKLRKFEYASLLVFTSMVATLLFVSYHNTFYFSPTNLWFCFIPLAVVNINGAKKGIFFTLVLIASNISLRYQFDFSNHKINVIDDISLYSIKYLFEHSLMLIFMLAYSIMHLSYKKKLLHDLKLNQQNLLIEREKRYKSTKLAAIGELAAGVGHEINNPLAIALGYLQLSKKELSSRNILDKSLLIRFEKQEDALIRIRNIVKVLRKFARSETEGSEIFSIADAINESLEMVSEIYNTKNVNITNVLPNTSLFVQGNSQNFQQALVNILCNAMDAMDKQETKVLKISLTPADGDKAKVIIEDNGIGMSEKIRNKMFETFFTTKDIGKGTGLGMGITAQVINSFNGTINVESELNVGTKIYIELPLVPHLSSSTEMTSEARMLKKNLVAHNILVVDDEEDIRLILKETLERYGCNVDLAENGLIALEKVKTKGYDIVFTDMKMPRMDGLSLLHETHKLNLTNKPKLVVITGGVNFDFSKEGNGELASLIDGYILKPVDIKELEKYILENPSQAT